MIQIITDSTSYLPKSKQEEYNIDIIDLMVNFKEESFKERELENHDFYEKMRDEGIPKSSQPAVGEILKTMHQHLKNGDDIIGIFLSSKMSGTFQSAMTCKALLLEEFPLRKIEIIDSQTNSMQLGLQALQIAKAKEAGMSFDGLVSFGKTLADRSRFIFIPKTLDYLREGGRIGAAGALLGNALKLIPLLTVVSGETSSFKTVRTRKRALKEIQNQIEQDHEAFEIKTLVIHHIDAEKEALGWKEILETQFSFPIEITAIGPVIGMHVGPGAIGVCYLTKEIIKL